MSLLEMMGKGAVVASIGAAAAMCAGLFAWQTYARHAADAEAARIMADAKIHKTDPDQNGASVRDALARRAEANLDDVKTPRTCAVRALTLVWRQKWHFDDAWSQAAFDEASAAVNDPLCRHELEAQLARATLYAGSCRRRDPDHATVADCALAIEATQAFFGQVPTTDDVAWLRVEGAWQEVRARSALAGRYLETHNAAVTGEVDSAFARCAEAEAWAGYAPVNAPELWDECAVVAGYAYDVTRFLHYADLRLATLPTESRARRNILGHFFTAAGPECRSTKVAWKKSRVAVTGDAWCAGLGHVARGCGSDAVAVLRSATLDTAHPWALLASAAAARGDTCLQ